MSVSVPLSRHLRRRPIRLFPSLGPVAFFFFNYAVARNFKYAMSASDLPALWRENLSNGWRQRYYDIWYATLYYSILCHLMLYCIISNSILKYDSTAIHVICTALTHYCRASPFVHRRSIIYPAGSATDIMGNLMKYRNI